MSFLSTVERTLSPTLIIWIERNSGGSYSIGSEIIYRERRKKDERGKEREREGERMAFKEREGKKTREEKREREGERMAFKGLLQLNDQKETSVQFPYEYSMLVHQKSPLQQKVGTASPEDGGLLLLHEEEAMSSGRQSLSLAGVSLCLPPLHRCSERQQTAFESGLRIIVDHDRGTSTPPLQCSTTETGAGNSAPAERQCDADGESVAARRRRRYKLGASALDTAMQSLFNKGLRPHNSQEQHELLITSGRLTLVQATLIAINKFYFVGCSSSSSSSSNNNNSSSSSRSNSSTCNSNTGHSSNNNNNSIVINTGINASKITAQIA
ncbi:hypothetical protein FHG87_004189 [Trinorchestia longiramus]|nr:hypothetical protein FHG87_004189 [Trinorchestia longiramus]